MENLPATRMDIEMTGPEILSFLEGYELGTPGGLRYRHTAIPERIRAMQPLPFLVLRRSGRIAGLIGFSIREAQIAGESFQVSYIRYFMFSTTYRRKGRREGGKSSPGRTPGFLKEAVHRILEEPRLLLEGEEQAGTAPVLTYAFIEQDNERSAAFGEGMGFRKVREIDTYLYTRFLPRRHPGVERAGQEEQAWVLERLSSYYRSSGLFTSRNLFTGGQTWVCRQEGRIVAGLQASPEEWLIREMPGIDGFLFTRVFPYLPLLRGMISKGRLRFLALEGIWAGEGYEHCLPRIIAHALAVNRRKLAMTWADPGGPPAGALQRAGRRGMIGSLFHPARGNLVVRAIPGREDLADRIRQHPVYVSCLDMT